jgi:hypothetical protein
MHAHIDVGLRREATRVGGYIDVGGWHGRRSLKPLKVTSLTMDTKSGAQCPKPMGTM